jgi:signal transduction histidine kinase
MTSIKGYVDLISDGDTGEINHLQREFLQTVQRNTRRLVSMINDMLDIERIESGGVEFDLRPLVLSMSSSRP